jgi:hypothetical protein
MSDFGHFGSDEEYATVRKHNAEVVSFHLYSFINLNLITDGLAK